MRTKVGLCLIAVLMMLSVCSAVALIDSSVDGDTDSEEELNKTKVTIEVDGLSQQMMIGKASISSIVIKNGDETLNIEEYVEIVISEPSGQYYAVAMYSDGLNVVNGLFPTHPGTFIITISIIDGNDDYYGEYTYEFKLVENENEINNNDGGGIFLYVAAAILISLGAFVVYIVVFKRGLI